MHKIRIINRPWGSIHSPFFWRRNPRIIHGFLRPWISPPFLLGFLLSPQPHSQTFPRKPSVLASRIFFAWFLLGFEKPSSCLVFLRLFMFDMKTKLMCSSFYFIIAQIYSKDSNSSVRHIKFDAAWLTVLSMTETSLYLAWLYRLYIAVQNLGVVKC